jgi:MFS family permease
MPIRFAKDLQYYKFCAYGFLKNMDFFDPFLILFFREKGLSFLEIGTLYALREIMINIFEIPTGMLADTMGRRRTLVSAFAFYIVSFIIFYFSGSYALFVVAIVFYGYGDAFRSGVHKAMIFEYLKLNNWHDQKAHYYGHTRSWSQTGSAVSAVIAGALVFITGSYSIVFIAATLPYLLDLILIASYPKELDGKKRVHSRSQILQSFKETFLDFVSAITNKFVLGAILTQAVYTGYYKAVKDYLQPVLKTLALALPILTFAQGEKRAAIVVGIAYFFIYMATAWMSRHSGRFAERYPNLVRPLNYTMLVGLTAGALSGILFYIGWLWVSIALFVFILLIENLRKPIGIAAVADQLEKDIMATAMSAESQAETLVAAILAPILGYFADLYGVGPAITIASVLLLVLFPFYKAKNKAIR